MTSLAARLRRQFGFQFRAIGRMEGERAENSRVTRIITSIVIALTVGFVGSASADVVFGTCVEFSGATPPEGTPPWVTARFADSGYAVRLTMDAYNLVDVEFIGEWLFNVDPAAGVDPADLVFTRIEGDGPTAADTTVLRQAEAFKADGDGFFDIKFEFPPPPGGDAKFQAGEYVVWDITRTGIDLDPWMFNWISSGSAGGLFTAAHIQGIGIGGDDSGWVTIPAPGAALLGVIGLGLVGRIWRRIT
jgi:hypothetical protein